jgi:proteasome assembly chaperone (PAC2) family protein
MKMFKEIRFDSPPIMFAAWPGMGNVGIIAMDYLRNKLDAKVFAEIDMSSFFIPDSIIVKSGIAQLPEIPGSVFSYLQNPSVIIFESNAQVGGKDGITIIKTILNIAEQFHVTRIYTAAAFAQPMSHKAPSKVMGACNNPSLFFEFEKYHVEPMPDGYIAGQNGLLLGVAATRNIDSCCFLGTIPSFASNLSYPKASLEIVKTFGQILNYTFSYTELEESIATVDKQLAAIEDRIREYFPSVMEKEEEVPEVEDEEVPKYIMDKIEKLFSEAENDRSKAYKLKEELDRWKIYELYEHRFLNLFKNKDIE